MKSILNLMENYSNQLTTVLICLLAITITIGIWLYFHNRKKYHNFKHQIPASVVKNYLDSIIQNSTALKSSLFRGGGLDVDPSSIPSVLPLDQLSGSTPASVGGASDEALQAEVARLRSQLSEKQTIISDLENKNTELEGNIKAKQERIEELEKLLAEAKENNESSGGGNDEALQAQLSELTKERDQLKEDLAQYDIIEDDLADLKRLKQENEQLKAAVGDDATPSEPAPEVASAPVEEPAVEEPTAEEPAPEEPADEPVAAAEEAPESSEDDDKSPEDLLSEFEKMLG